MKRNNQPLDDIGRCFDEMDSHKMQVENHIMGDIKVVFAGLKDYL